VYIGRVDVVVMYDPTEMACVVSESWCMAFQCLLRTESALDSQRELPWWPLHKSSCLGFSWPHRACVSSTLLFLSSI